MRPKCRTVARDHLVDLLRLADVDLHGERIEPGMPQLRASRCSRFVGVAAADRRSRAPSSPRRLRDRQADAGAAAGDDGDLALEEVSRCKHRTESD